MICSQCGKTILDDDKYCIYCGSKVTEKCQCINCQKNILITDKYCIYCGTRTTYQNAYTANNGNYQRNVNYNNSQNYSNDYYDDTYEEPTSTYKTPFIITIILLVIMCSISIILIINYNNIKSDLVTYKNKNSALINDNENLANQINTLQEQITEYQNILNNYSYYPNNYYYQDYYSYTSSNYMVTVDGVKLREGPGTEYAQVRYDYLPSNLKTVVKNGSNGNAFVSKDAVVTILETVSFANDSWGRLADNVWICMSKNGESYLRKIN